MLETVQILAPILLVDILNPVLLALLIFAASTDKPVANSAAMLLGHTITYFIAGYGLSFAVEKLSALMENPGAVDYAISGLLGVYCLYWSLKPAKPSTEPDIPDWQLTPLKCLFFGGVVNVIGLPFAVPYLGAIDQILKADVSLTEAWTLLGLYNVVYAMPFAIVPGSILLMGERSKPLLESLSRSMDWLADKAMPWLILVLGLWLVYDAVAYFW
ncbi:MAG: GAP family protein [Halioglobus sp.]